MNSEQIKSLFSHARHFDSCIDIPRLPVPDDKESMETLTQEIIRLGGIPKEELEVGATYYGSCRNANEAVWKGDHFTIKRYKFGSSFDEDIKHFSDESRFDVFIPIKKR